MLRFPILNKNLYAEGTVNVYLSPLCRPLQFLVRRYAPTVIRAGHKPTEATVHVQGLRGMPAPEGQGRWNIFSFVKYIKSALCALVHTVSMLTTAGTSVMDNGPSAAGVLNVPSTASSGAKKTAASLPPSHTYSC